MPLSESQRERLSDYLSRNPKKCGNCGNTEWEFGEIDVYAADPPVVGSEKITPHNGLTYVRVTCRSCGEEDGVDCVEAGIDDSEN